MRHSFDRGFARVFDYQAVALSAGVFLTIVSVQVALARHARPIATVAFGVAAVLAMTGVAYASVRASAGTNGLPDDLVLYVLRVSASLYAVVLLATTCAAVWLSRRDPQLRASLHWAMTAAAGLLMYALATHSRFLQLDIMTAVQDGPGPRVVVHPTPEERIARARTLPGCSIRPLTPRPAKSWRWQEVRRFAARLPMPAEMHEDSDEVPDSSEVHQWEHDRWGTIVLMLDGEAQYSDGFSVSGGQGTATEPPCGLQIGSNIVPVTRSAAAVRRHGGETVDSVFGASTDIPYSLPDTQIGVGIVARTRAGRDTLLSMIAAIRFSGREKRR
jgi:hypothetical protein